MFPCLSLIKFVHVGNIPSVPLKLCRVVSLPFLAQSENISSSRRSTLLGRTVEVAEFVPDQTSGWYGAIHASGEAVEQNPAYRSVQA